MFESLLRLTLIRLVIYLTYPKKCVIPGMRTCDSRCETRLWSHCIKKSKKTLTLLKEGNKKETIIQKKKRKKRTIYILFAYEICLSLA